MYAEGRVEHQKRTQTATTLWPFGFVFGVQLGLLEKKKTRRGPVRAALVHIEKIKKQVIVMVSTFFLVNHVERQKRTQPRLLEFVFGVQLGLRQTQ